MDRSTLNKLSYEQYLDYFDDNIFDDIDTIINISKGHSREMHIGLSDEQMLERIIKEGKSGVSTFLNEEEMKEFMIDALYYVDGQIATWMTSERNEFKNPKDYHNFVVTVDMKEDIVVGRGFNSDFKEYNTPVINIILQRDISGESPMGFFVKTAYADIFHENAKETGVQYSINEILNNEKIHFSDDISKLYFILQQQYKNESIQLKENKGQKFIQMNFQNNDDKIIAYINNIDTTIKRYKNDSCKKLSYAECFFENSHAAEIIASAENIKRDFSIVLNKNRNQNQGISH